MSALPNLETKVFTVTIQYAKGTRWLVSDDVLRKGMQARHEHWAAMFTKGPLPIVTVVSQEAKP